MPEWAGGVGRPLHWHGHVHRADQGVVSVSHLRPTDPRARAHGPGVPPPWGQGVGAEECDVVAMVGEEVGPAVGEATGETLEDWDLLLQAGSEMAAALRERVRQGTGLRCSAGIRRRSFLLSPSPSLTRTYSLPPSPWLTRTDLLHARTPPLAHQFACSHSFTLSLFHARTNACTHTHTRARIHKLPLAHALSGDDEYLSLAVLSLSPASISFDVLSLSHTHTHSHNPSLSFSSSHYILFSPSISLFPLLKFSLTLSIGKLFSFSLTLSLSLSLTPLSISFIHTHTHTHYFSNTPAPLRPPAGIAHNKLLAKLASGLHKPDDQTTLPSSQARRFLSDLPPRAVAGVGHKTATALEAMGVASLRQLRRVSLGRLRQTFGARLGSFLFDSARCSPQTPPFPPPDLPCALLRPPLPPSTRRDLSPPPPPHKRFYGSIPDRQDSD